MRPRSNRQDSALRTFTVTESCAYTTAIAGFGLYTLRRLFWLQTLYPGYAMAWLDVAAVVAASIGLLSLGWIAARRDATPAWTTALAGALLGIVFFVSTLGFALVRPSHIGWLLRGDWAQHFIGWQFFRNAPWTWPPGVFDTFWYPVGTAIAYTDSLPLLALPLKLVSALLPTHFQYIGFWLMLNCILQGVFGTLLTRCFTRRYTAQVLGAGFFLLAPVFIQRINHDTLTTQWLLLAGMWLYFRDQTEWHRPLLIWSLLAAIAALTHPYLGVMLLALATAYYLRERFASRQLTAMQCAMRLATLIAITLTCWWLSGIFTLSPSPGKVAMGVYNANLLTWFDSGFLSRWLPALPHAGNGQYEGFGYLGSGVLLLAALALLLACRPRQQRLVATAWWPLLAIIGALTVFAFSTRFTLGSHVLFDITSAQLPWIDSFRGSGRFIWCSCYLITLLAVAGIARRAGVLASPLLASAFLLQIFELAPLHVADAQMRVGNFRTPAEQVLHDPFWNTAVAGKSHITLVPPPACGRQAAPYFPFSLLAADHGLTINTGYLARFDEKRTFAYCDVLKQQLDRGDRADDTLYIVSDAMLDRFHTTSSVPLDCRTVEGYIACMASAASASTVPASSR